MRGPGADAHGAGSSWSGTAVLRLAEVMGTLPYCEALAVGAGATWESRAPGEGLAVPVQVSDMGRWRALCERIAVAMQWLPGVTAQVRPCALSAGEGCEELVLQVREAGLAAGARRARLELAVTVVASLVQEERQELYRESYQRG